MIKLDNVDLLLACDGGDGWQLVRGAPCKPDPGRTCVQSSDAASVWHTQAQSDFLQGFVVYGNISIPEVHFSVKYDNVPHNQVRN